MPLPEDVYAELNRRLAPVDAAGATAFPGARTTRQPVHTCCVLADAVVPGLAAVWGAEALPALDEPATARALATVVLRGLDCGAPDDGEVRTATGVDRPELARPAGRSRRIDTPATGRGGPPPTIPS
jgi:uncharacterized protein DUF6986